MKFLPFFALALLPLLGLSACSKETPAEPPLADSSVREIHTANQAASDELAAAATLGCEIKAGCSEAVGMYVAATSTSVLTCTSFLVAEDTIATNSHCLPAFARGLTDLSAQNIQVIFPATAKRPEERFRAVRLLGNSERPNAVSPDLMLLKLASGPGPGPGPARKPLLVDAKGVAPDTPVRTWKINPGPGGASGVMVEQACVAKPNLYRLPIYQNEKAPLVTFGDCQSIGGNSGSPVVNAEGKVVAALQASLPIDDLRRRAWEPNLLPGESFVPLALGTSLACLKSTTEWNWAAAACPVTDEESITRARIGDFPQATDTLTNEYRARYPQLRWHAEVLVDRALIQETEFSPECFLAAPEESAPAEVEIPTIAAKIRFNRYTQFQAQAEVISTHSHPVSLFAADGPQYEPVENVRYLPFCL